MCFEQGKTPRLGPNLAISFILDMHQYYERFVLFSFCVFCKEIAPKDIEYFMSLKS